MKRKTTRKRYRQFCLLKTPIQKSKMNDPGKFASRVFPGKFPVVLGVRGYRKTQEDPLSLTWCFSPSPGVSKRAK